MDTQYLEQPSESTAECGTDCKHVRPTPAHVLSWEEKNVPFPVPFRFSDSARKLWPHYGILYRYDPTYASVFHQMLERWEIVFQPLIDAADTLIDGLESEKDECDQLHAIFRAMKRMCDDFWEIWKFTRFMVADDPFIRGQLEKAETQRKADAGGVS